MYINQLFYVHFGRASFASKTYQKPSLRTKILKLSRGSVNWPDHSKITSSGPAGGIRDMQKAGGKNHLYIAHRNTAGKITVRSEKRNFVNVLMLSNNLPKPTD